MTGGTRAGFRPQRANIADVVSTINCHFQAHFIVLYEMRKYINRKKNWTFRV